ncbi:hypothetical protein DUNSADRAFT_7371 [Dunaliella salina]|uniref:Encoded protein n=1 Tax=Dunaliella salina TaxID=3046 RepID=A0ABQ7H6A4_DUNSA|nr:hypothetical protein DUNSADRAFT_7371 [Dunaliella salina]|eukprot:KAF5842387.1 hypothetical protein DUNSADRAFT_7371 [Dunaliella salina]
MRDNVSKDVVSRVLQRLEDQQKSSQQATTGTERLPTSIFRHPRKAPPAQGRSNPTGGHGVATDAQLAGTQVGGCTCLIISTNICFDVLICTQS